MTLNKKSGCSPPITVFFFFNLSSVEIFSKLIRIEISNRLQLLQYGGIGRDRQTVFVINNSCFVIIHICKSSSFNTKENRLRFSRGKPLFIRKANSVENCLIFRVVRVRVRALYKRAIRGKQSIVGFINFKFYFNWTSCSATSVYNFFFVVVSFQWLSSLFLFFFNFAKIIYSTFKRRKLL